LCLMVLILMGCSSVQKIGTATKPIPLSQCRVQVFATLNQAEKGGAIDGDSFVVRPIGF
jgi:uncharacterized protein YceK